MGGRSGGGPRGGGGADGGGNYRGPIKNISGLESIKDPQVRKAVYEAISRYESVMGIRQLNIKVADLGAGTLGVHVTQGGVSSAIYLDRKHFNQSKAAIIAQGKERYKSGWSTTTNKPIAHTTTHELAHATWNSHLVGAKYTAAGKEIGKLYNKWKADTKKSGYGKYASTNVNEFWAETVTKAVHGKADKYTKTAKAITKKYKL